MKRHKVTITLDSRVLDMLDYLSNRERRSRSSLIEFIIYRYLERESVSQGNKNPLRMEGDTIGAG